MLDLLDYWGEHTPPHISLIQIKQWMGIDDQGPPAEEEHRVMDQDELNAWIKSITG